jgi:enamine deaminase RidA (YjgF/YER057c/UK114 family)
VIEIGQPPLDDRASLEVSVQALIPRPGAALTFGRVSSRPDCDCAECARTHGVRIQLGAETRFHAAALYGAGATAYEQTLGMFTRAENMLREAGLGFGDVVRTWIHLRHMERDYPLLNTARREFFAARGIDPVPASTGICGSPPPGEHDLCMAVYAVRPAARTVMTSPTLNEAGEYGADFVRGMKVVEANRTALYVSGTASIDEQGRTAHVGDLDAQAERMLVNIAALLERQGATFGDVVTAITYLKRREDAAVLRQKLRKAGFEGFPHALVEAGICRPDLLCETEVLAVSP